MLHNTYSVEQIPNCFLCGKEGVLIYETVYDRMFDLTGVWNIVRCPQCGLVWLNPRPLISDIGRFYPNNYAAHIVFNQTPPKFSRIRQIITNNILAQSFGYKFDSSYISGLIGQILGKVNLFKNYAGLKVMWLEAKKGGKLLDVGCGNGNFLAKMHELGWQVTGVEPDADGVEVAKRHYKLADVFHGTLEQAKLLSNSFDAITLSHVIEHVSDPISLLKECKRILADDGKIVITAPNISSLGHYMFKHFWTHLDPPRHLLHFSPSTLSECVQQSGLTVQSLKTPSHASRYIWLTSRAIQTHGKLQNGILPRPIPIFDYLGSFIFLAFEQTAILFRTLGEEIVLIASK